MISQIRREAADTSAPVTHLFHHPDARELAIAFAERFTLIECACPPVHEPGFHLWAAADHLELRRDSVRRGVWVTVDELSRRAAEAGELLRACSAGAGDARLLDPMAGWGIDALVLARRGMQVTMVERHPALQALQQDLLRRTGLGGVTCRCGDGFTALDDDLRYDVVYLDPMFPARHKTALSGKRMQWTAELTAADARPLPVWLDAAIATATARVVLKRRRKDPPVLAPDWQIIGRTVRYDVYRGAGTR